MMHKKTLLLNSTYEVLSFISAKKAFKLLCKNKTEVISNWDDVISWGSGKIKHPSILKLKYHVKRNYCMSNFSRKSVVKRDKSTCQYCNKKLTAAQTTIDHVIPKAHGGVTSFNNCVVSCIACNSRKADKTPEQANMLLLSKPTHPTFLISHDITDPQEYWHEDWTSFLSNN